MKHQHSIDISIDELPTQDLEDLIAFATASVVVVIGVYMASDTARHILKTLIK